jgi:MFS family permease
MAQGSYNYNKLFVASCIALVTTAMAFFDTRRHSEGVGRDLQHQPRAAGAGQPDGHLGFPIAILIVGPLVNTFGMGRLLKFACLGHILGIVFTILSPNYGFVALLLSTLLVGLANGTVEAVINPLAATMYPNDKTHKLNVLHAWWPGGLIIGGLATFALAEFLNAPWQVRLGTIIVPALIYGAMIWTEKFPETERAASGVSMGDTTVDIGGH